GDPTAYDGEVLHRGTRLLDVLEPAGGPVELADRVDGRVHVPRAVRVDPDPPSRPEGVAHGLDAGDVGGQGDAGIGDLDLGGRAAGPPAQVVGRLGRPDGHRRVHGHAAAHRRRPVPGSRL